MEILLHLWDWLSGNGFRLRLGVRIFLFEQILNTHLFLFFYPPCFHGLTICNRSAQVNSNDA